VKKPFKAKFKRLIPGIITGGADNDPSGIATYSISGASFGFSQLWLMMLATPTLIAVQSMCAKLGNVHRKGLSVILRDFYSKPVSFGATAVLIIANVVTIGADIVAMGAALELVTHISLKYWVLPITLFIWYIVLFKNFRVIAKFLLVMVLFFFAYIAAAFLAQPDWSEIFRQTFWPAFRQFDRNYYVTAVAILGTTITPYLFFWQVKEEVEEHKTAQAAQSEARVEDRAVAPGLIFSQTVTFFIITATGATLHQRGISVQTAADAAAALAPVAGRAAELLFAIGIIGAGLLALPVLSASTAYVVAETAGWKRDSLSNQIHRAKGFYAVITLSLLAGVAVLISGIDPVRALYYSQILAGILAPFLLLLILVLSNSPKAMGEFRNGWFDNFFGTLAVVLMFGAGILMFFG
jgi:NRAMP (natural resistance-associated macrophage protein)-like metal ion transporter